MPLRWSFHTLPNPILVFVFEIRWQFWCKAYTCATSGPRRTLFHPTREGAINFLLIRPRSNPWDGHRWSQSGPRGDFDSATYQVPITLSLRSGNKYMRMIVASDFFLFFFVFLFLFLFYFLFPKLKYLWHLKTNIIISMREDGSWNLPRNEFGLLGCNASATARVISRRWNDDDEISFLVEETGVPGGNHRPTASNWWGMRGLYGFGPQRNIEIAIRPSRW